MTRAAGRGGAFVQTGAVMSTSFEVRRARPADLDAVAALTYDAYASAGFVARDAPYAAVLRDAATRARDAELLVAVDGDELLGTVTYVAGGGRLQEIARPSEAEFRMLAVAPSAGGRGIGGALVDHVVATARRSGRLAVVCSSRPTMHAAHRIYERAGFVRLPERDWSPVEGIDLLGFGLEL